MSAMKPMNPMRRQAQRGNTILLVMVLLGVMLVGALAMSRLAESLADMSAVLGERPAAVAREPAKDGAGEDG